jgi:hypothetical protein
VELLKIYCDTNALFNNMRHTDPKTWRQRIALRSLLKWRKFGKYLMFRSRVVRYEYEKNGQTEHRSKLQADYEALDQIPQDERPTVSFNITDRMGCVSNVVTSDYLNEDLYKELQRRGLDEKDAHHITHAVCNNCDVFLTRDEGTIIRPHRQWLEEKFPRLKIRLPSELVAERKTLCTASATP